MDSVGRGTPLLLNVPPTKEGLLAEEDVQRLQEFYQVVSDLYTDNLAFQAKVSCSNEKEGFPSSHLTDGREDTFWAPASDESAYVLEIDLGQTRSFNRRLYLRSEAREWLDCLCSWSDHWLQAPTLRTNG